MVKNANASVNEDRVYKGNVKRGIMGYIFKLAISIIIQDDAMMESLINDREDQMLMKHSIKTRKHFTDIFFTKTSLNTPVKEYNDIKANILNEKGDNITKKRETLSLRKIAMNFNLLSKQLNVVLSFIMGIISIINWERYDKTLAALLLYTWACIHPYFFLLYPIMFSIYYISRKYLIKHPDILKPSMAINNNELMNNWDEGLGPRLLNTKSEKIQGLFGFLWDSDDEMDYNTNNNETNNIIKLNLSDIDEIDFENVDEMLNYIEGVVVNSDNSKEVEIKKDDLKQQVKYRNFILKTLYDIQNQTSQILNILDSINNAFSENCDFIDEKGSTLLIYKLLIIIMIVFILGSYIPWKLIFILLGWIGIFMNHPKRVIFFKKLTYESSKKDNEKMNDDKRVELGLFSSDDIIIDESIFSRKVEIFELEKQDIMRLNEYIKVGFTNNVFSISDKNRLKRKIPNCVNDINEVLPPINIVGEINFKKDKDLVKEIENMDENVHVINYKNRLNWVYINGEEWEISDTKWMSDYCLNYEMYIKPNEVNGWVYDITGEFRRRRLTRHIIQQG